MPTMYDLEPPARELTSLFAEISDDELDRPTPCEGTTVAGLLDHFVTLTRAFQDSARKTTQQSGGPPPQASGDNLDPDWRRLLPLQLQDLTAAWRDPAAWEGQTQAGGITMPAQVMGCVAVSELVLHGWDVARATGRDFSCDDASLQAVHTFTSMMSVPGQEAGREGLYGPIIPVPDDAPAFDQVLGLSGRAPDWSPPSR